MEGMAPGHGGQGAMAQGMVGQGTGHSGHSGQGMVFARAWCLPGHGGCQGMVWRQGLRR